MGKMLIACVLVASGCSMYGEPAPKLKNPSKVAQKDNDKDKDKPPPTPPYVEECTVDFGAPPTTKRQPKAAEQLVVTADTTIETGTKAQADQARVEAIRLGIETYRQALIKDPYSPEATLKLALAYDKVLRKGCALAMLKRLSKLATNPTFKAEPAIDRVVDNQQWFKGYRTDALRAIGH